MYAARKSDILQRPGKKTIDELASANVEQRFACFITLKPVGESQDGDDEQSEVCRVRLQFAPEW
jgi:hypothetical protein